eukprot:COSAG02_NODE_5819_length_4016_cov_1.859586_4_plen_53_part_00
MHKTVAVCTGFPYYFHCNLHSWVAFLIHVLAGLHVPWPVAGTITYVAGEGVR